MGLICHRSHWNGSAFFFRLMNYATQNGYCTTFLIPSQFPMLRVPRMCPEQNYRQRYWRKSYIFRFQWSQILNMWLTFIIWLKSQKMSGLCINGKTTTSSNDSMRFFGHMIRPYQYKRWKPINRFWNWPTIAFWLWVMLWQTWLQSKHNIHLPNQ